MRRLRYIFIVISVMLSITSFAQRYYFHQFEAKSGYGFTVPHRQDLKYLIKSNFINADLSYSLKTDGSESWHHEWRFPEIGLAYHISGLGNINVFGFAQSIYGFASIPIYEKERILVKYKLGLGIAYLTEKYHTRANYYNVAIGSFFNSHIHISFWADFKAWEDIPLYFTVGTALNHFSNTAIAKPNLGLNLVTLNTGVKYMFSEFEYSLPKRTRPYPEKNYIASFYYAGGVRQNSTYENKKYVTHSLVSDIAFKYNPKRSFGLGFDIIVDPSIKGQIIEDINYQYAGFQQNLRVGFHLSHDVYLSDELVCLMHLGAYAYNKYNPSNKYLVYSRIGVRYIFEENFFANIILKSHTSVADYLEIGIGYRIKN